MKIALTSHQRVLLDRLVQASVQASKEVRSAEALAKTAQFALSEVITCLGLDSGGSPREGQQFRLMHEEGKDYLLLIDSPPQA